MVFVWFILDRATDGVDLARRRESSDPNAISITPRWLGIPVFVIATLEFGLIFGLVTQFPRIPYSMEYLVWACAFFGLSFWLLERRPSLGVARRIGSFLSLVFGLLILFIALTLRTQGLLT